MYVIDQNELPLRRSRRVRPARGGRRSLAGVATELVEFSSAEERREWIKRKQDELAARRQARAGQ
jgi:hypothetical protein